VNVAIDRKQPPSSPQAHGICADNNEEVWTRRKSPWIRSEVKRRSSGAKRIDGGNERPLIPASSFPFVVEMNQVDEYLLRKERGEKRDSLKESSTEDKGGEKVLRCSGGTTDDLPSPGCGRYPAEMNLKSLICLEEGR